MKTVAEKALQNSWRIALDLDMIGADNGWQTQIPACAENAIVPALIQENIADYYTGAAWLWNEFEIDNVHANEDCFLKIGKTELLERAVKKRGFFA